MRALIYGGLIASAMMVPAFAQNNPPASSGASPPAAQPSSPAPSSSSATAPKAQGEMWRASKLIGLNVYNDKNEKVGNVEDLIINKDRSATYAIVSTGGFLGIGSHDVAIPAAQFTMTVSVVGTVTSPNGSAAAAGSAGSLIRNRCPSAVTA